jgi:hypothetical protein
MEDPVRWKLLGEATTDSLTVDELIGYGARLIAGVESPESRFEAALVLWDLACAGLLEFLTEHASAEGAAADRDAYGIWPALKHKRTPESPIERVEGPLAARQRIARLLAGNEAIEAEAPLRCYATAEGRRFYESGGGDVRS